MNTILYTRLTIQYPWYTILQYPMNTNKLLLLLLLLLLLHHTTLH
jgi:hypothetical protein